MFSAGNLAARVRRDANPGRRAYGALTKICAASTLLSYPRLLRSLGDHADRCGAHGSDDCPAWRLVRL